MKKITTILVAVLLTASAFAQAPQKMTYQAVVRNISNNLAQSSPIGIKVSILQGSVTGTAVYVETHTTQTNQNGLLNIEIGGGVIVSGAFQNSIDWEAGPYFLKTEIDPSGGTNYTITSTSELLSVPYSNYAKVAGNLAGYASDFVGAYKPFSGSFIIGYATIVYLGPDKVALNVFIEDVDNASQITYYGTVNGNTITFPNDNVGAYYGTAIKTGNSLDLTIYDYDNSGNPVPNNAILIKQ